MESTKLKIAGIVGTWELENWAAFYQFVEAKRVKTDKLADKHASVQGGDGLIERLLHEIPETLYGELTTKLNEEEMQFFQSRDGSLWFAKTFPAYRVAQTV